MQNRTRYTHATVTRRSPLHNTFCRYRHHLRSIVFVALPFTALPVFLSLALTSCGGITEQLDELTVRRINVVDTEGNNRILLTSEAGTTQIIMQDKNGKPHVSLTLDEQNRAHIQVRDAAGAVLQEWTGN